MPPARLYHIVGLPDLELVVMSVRGMQSWPQRAVSAGAVLAAVALAGVVQPAAAQYSYDYGYPAQAYSYPPQPYPTYPSYPSYGQQYYGGDDWGSGRHWQDRAWSGEDWRRGDRSDAADADFVAPARAWVGSSAAYR